MQKSVQDRLVKRLFSSSTSDFLFEHFDKSLLPLIDTGQFPQHHRSRWLLDLGPDFAG